MITSSSSQMMFNINLWASIELLLGLLSFSLD